MKKFILYIFLYLLPILVSAILLEIFLRQIPNDYSYKKNYLDTHAGKIETLVLGSSHTYYGIDPVYFSENTFNEAHISQSLDYDYAILQRYDEKLVNLKTVIIPVSYFTLWGKLKNGSESWRIKNYILYYGIIHDNDSLKFYFEILSNSFKTNVGRIKWHLHGGNNVTSSELGWGQSYNSSKAKNLEETGKTAANRHTKDNIFSHKNQMLFANNGSYLDSIIQICQKHHAKVILFTPPAYKTYREHLNEEQLNAMIVTANEIANNHSNSIYINLMEDSTFIATDYFDADHLSEIGAKKLSLKLNSYIKEQ
jgi:hypothetical protein